MDLHFVGLEEIAEALGVATLITAAPRSSIFSRVLDAYEQVTAAR
jgi:hypothetical protein